MPSPYGNVGLQDHNRVLEADATRGRDKPTASRPRRVPPSGQRLRPVCRGRGTVQPGYRGGCFGIGASTRLDVQARASPDLSGPPVSGARDTAVLHASGCRVTEREGAAVEPAPRATATSPRASPAKPYWPVPRRVTFARQGAAFDACPGGIPCSKSLGKRAGRRDGQALPAGALGRRAARRRRPRTVSKVPSAPPGVVGRFVSATVTIRQSAVHDPVAVSVPGRVTYDPAAGDVSFSFRLSRTTAGSSGEAISWSLL